MRMKLTRMIVVAAAAGLAGVASRASSAGVIAQWNFNSTSPDATSTTGSTAPSVGTGTLTTIGGASSAFAVGSPSDPAASDNTALQTSAYPATSSSGTAGVQVSVSTLGQAGPVQISLDFRQSGTASRYFQLQASSDGTNFANVSGGAASIATPGNNSASFSNAGLYANTTNTTTTQFVQGISYTFPAGSVYENDPNFAFRFVSVFDPTTGNTSYTGSNGTYSGSTGTARFDMVTVAPEPTSACMFGVGGLLLLGRRRRAR